LRTFLTSCDSLKKLRAYVELPEDADSLVKAVGEVLNLQVLVMVLFLDLELRVLEVQDAQLDVLVLPEQPVEVVIEPLQVASVRKDLVSQLGSQIVPLLQLKLQPVSVLQDEVVLVLCRAPDRLLQFVLHFLRAKVS